MSTKSTVLAPIVKKASEVKKIDDSKIGNLIKIKNVSITVHNGSDILAAKAVMSGLLKQIPVEGVGQMDLSGLADAFLKGASYILTGLLPQRVKTDNANTQILMKIPMQMDNEMESWKDNCKLLVIRLTFLAYKMGGTKGIQATSVSY